MNTMAEVWSQEFFIFENRLQNEHGSKELQDFIVGDGPHQVIDFGHICSKHVK
mgnify:CR=1 FL=1